MMSAAPETFELVDLDDPSTFHNVTIQEWMKLRAELRARIPDEKQQRRLQSQISAAHKRAHSTLRGEERARGRRLGTYLSGRQLARYRQLLRQELSARISLSGLLSTWEKRFYEASGWLDEIRLARPSDGPMARHAKMLLRWCQESDRVRALHLGEYRGRSSASTSIYAGGGMPAGKNGFLPEPIELLPVFRLAYLMVLQLRAGAEYAQKFDLKIDRYGAAFPCRKCGELFFYLEDANSCCKPGYPTDVCWKMARAIPQGSRLHLRHLERFYRLLWRFGYDTPTAPHEALKWDLWPGILSTSRSAFVRAFLGLVFCASPETVRRRLAHDSLLKAYERFRIQPSFRDFLGRNRLGGTAIMRPRGWYLNEDRPIRPDRGRQLALSRFLPPEEYEGFAVPLRDPEIAEEA